MKGLCGLLKGKRYTRRVCDTDSRIGPESVLGGTHMTIIMSGNRRASRRSILRQVGDLSLVGVAGCIGAAGLKELQGPVPAVYRTATSQGGTKRNPDALTSKGGANYSSAVGEREQTCAICRYYISDRNGDGLGACSVVEGNIEPDAWCTLYAPSREPTA